MFITNGRRRSDAYVAAQIYQIWVEDAVQKFVEHFLDSKRSRIAANLRGSFISKIRLYCEASVLRVLQTEKERNKGYAGLIQEFERIVVQSTTMYERATKREVTNSAILFLEQLIFEEEKRLSLARDWFASSGYDETNPATLLGFVRFIGSDTQSLRELIRELGPPAKP